MKIRNGFVSNSSSSSFICITSNKGNIIVGDEEYPEFEIDTIRVDIDTLINNLIKAKESGATEVIINYGGGYDG